MKVLAVIPARGGSKGIPRKNMRFMNGKPLIAYSIDNALACEYCSDVIVTSDDEEVALYARSKNVMTIDRSAELAGDKITLDPVVYDALVRAEKIRNANYDYVITLQPTSPLLTPQTLSNSIKEFLDKGADTAISACNAPHLSWSKSQNDNFVPNYEKRLNRQQLPANYVETGAFLICKRVCCTPTTRIGQFVTIAEIPENESTDIDNEMDWVQCEAALRHKRIVFRTDGYRDMGLGHLWHCLSLAYRLTGHQIMFVLDERYQIGVDVIKNSFFPYTIVSGDADFYEFLRTYKPDIVINDRLNTTSDYVLRLKALAPRVVTVEDLGEGANCADAVINALYERPGGDGFSNHFYGSLYTCLREEFQLATPKEFSSDVKELFIMFGGADPANLTEKLYKILCRDSFQKRGVHVNIVAGLAYDAKSYGVTSRPDLNIAVYENIKLVSGLVASADLAVISKGRGAYEVASLGVPSIVMSQNSREGNHGFMHMGNGFVNLGYGSEVSDETLLKTIEWLIDAPQVRHEMRNILLSHELKSGINRCINIILGEINGKKETIL